MLRARNSIACREAKNADHLLSIDEFSFMRNDCSADKWVAIKLSQRIKLTAVDISMLELYSSRVKTFDLYGSLTKPTKTDSMPWRAELWSYIATMKLENKKGQQVCTVLRSNDAADAMYSMECSAPSFATSNAQTELWSALLLHHVFCRHSTLKLINFLDSCCCTSRPILATSLFVRSTPSAHLALLRQKIWRNSCRRSRVPAMIWTHRRSPLHHRIPPPPRNLWIPQAPHVLDQE